MLTQQIHILKKCNRYNPFRSISELHPSGFWLEKLGFHIGDYIRITTREKLLIIEPVKKD